MRASHRSPPNTTETTMNDRSTVEGRRTRRVLITRGAALVAGLVAAPTLLRAQQKFTCRIAHTEGIGTPITLAFEKWAGLLRERSGGRIDAQHFPAAQLGGLAQALEGSRIGTIQVTTAGPDSEEAVAPEIAAFGGAPGFIYKDEAHVDRVLQGPLGKEVSDIARKKTGVEFVAYGETGFRHILSKRPVTSLDTLKGLKIRVPELRIWVDFWRKLGANPTPLPYSEQYSALSTGVIDALDSDFFSIIGFKWHEQAKDLTLTAHWFLPKAVRVNARWLDGLPADLQQVVRTSATEVFAEQRATNRANAAKALADLEKLGVKVNKIGDAERAKWAELTAPLFAEFGSKSAETKVMIDKIRQLG
jgi:tripartite ATP-independent transporter DctP family solute receptor